MALPSLGTLPPAGSPGIGAQLGSALGDLPQMIQQAQMQKLQTEEQKSQVGQQLYAQLGQTISADPSKAGDPALVRRALDIAKMTGLPPPLKMGPSDGQQILDVDVLAPKPDFDKLTPQERIQGMSLPAEQRATLYGKMRNVPAEYLTAPQYIPPSAGAVTAMTQQLDKQVEDLSSGKLDPIRFAQNIRGQAQNLQAMGIKTDEYLSPQFLNAQISTYAQAQVDRLKSLGIHLQNEDTLKAVLERDKRNEFGATMGYKFATLNERTQRDQGNLAEKTRHDQKLEAKWASDQSLAFSRLQQGSRRLDDYEANLDSMIQNRAITSDFKRIGVLQKAYGQTVTEYNALQGQYAGAIKAIQGAANAGVQPDPRLVDLSEKLQARLGTLDAKLQAYGPAINQATNQSATATIGDGSRRVEIPGQAPPRSTVAPPPASPNSQRYYSPDRKQYWENGHTYDATTGRPVN